MNESEKEIEEFMMLKFKATEDKEDLIIQTITNFLNSENITEERMKKSDVKEMMNLYYMFLFNRGELYGRLKHIHDLEFERTVILTKEHRSKEDYERIVEINEEIVFINESILKGGSE